MAYGVAEIQFRDGYDISSPGILADLAEYTFEFLIKGIFHQIHSSLRVAGIQNLPSDLMSLDWDRESQCLRHA